MAWWGRRCGVGGEREECAWGISCWYAVDGRCRRVHSAEQEAHFEAKRRLLEAERREECGFCKLGRCRYGERCRRRRRGSDGDSDYSDEDGEGVRRVREAEVEAVDERRSLGGVLLEEGGFVPPRPGVFPPLPRPKVGAKREQRDVKEEVEARGSCSGGSIGEGWWRWEND